MKLKEYENRKYPGIHFFFNPETRKFFAVMGSLTALHETGLIDEETYQETMNSPLRAGVIFAEDKEHLFQAENLVKAKLLIQQMLSIVENYRRNENVSK